MGPENGWLEDEIPFWEGLFSGAMLVSGRVLAILPKISSRIAKESGLKQTSLSWRRSHPCTCRKRKVFSVQPQFSSGLTNAESVQGSHGLADTDLG